MATDAQERKLSVDDHHRHLTVSEEGETALLSDLLACLVSEEDEIRTASRSLKRWTDSVLVALMSGYEPNMFRDREWKSVRRALLAVYPTGVFRLMRTTINIDDNLSRRHRS